MQGLMEDFMHDIALDSAPFLGEIYNNLGDMIMYFEKHIDNVLQQNAISIVYKCFYIFFLSLLALKAIKKGFFIYIMCRDGDYDESPKEIIVSIILAVSAACFFPLIYPLCADMSLDFINKIISMLFQSETPAITVMITQILEAFATSTLQLIMFIIYLIGLLIFWFQALKRSIEMFALRISFPIACVGFIDSDSGIAKAYIKILCQSTVTTIFQLCCFSLSQALLNTGNLMFALGAIITAVCGPTLMSAIMAHTGGSGNVGHKIQQTVSTVNILRSFMGGK